MSHWYLLSDGKPIGPVDDQAAEAMLRGGLPVTHVAEAVEPAEWVALADHPLFASFAKPPSPSPSPPQTLTPSGGSSTAMIAVGTIALFGLFVWLVSRSSEQPVSTPDLAAPSAAIQATDDSAQLASVNSEIATIWDAFDASTQKTTASLKEAIYAAAAKADTLRPALAVEFHKAILTQARKRMGPLIRPETTTEGPINETLVPSKNHAACVLWGSIWINDDETLDALASLQFERVACSDKMWIVQEEHDTCFIYWDPSSGNKRDDVVFVWKDLDGFHRAPALGRQRGEEATMRYLVFSSERASAFESGSRFVIVERGPDWTKIRNDVASGYVEPSTCHRRPKH